MSRLRRYGTIAASLSAGLLVGQTTLVRAQTAEIDCAAPACEQALSPACLERIGAGAIEARGGEVGDACASENAAYVACLRAVAETCGGPALQSSGACSAEDARAEWARLSQSNAVEELEALAGFCGDTLHGRLAAARAKSLREAASASATSETGGGVGAARGASELPTVAVQADGARAVSTPTEVKGCLPPVNAGVVFGAWTMQVREQRFGQPYLILGSAAAAEPGEDDFVGLEYLRSSNGWFRYRTASGDRRTVFRSGSEGTQTIATKRFDPKPAARTACAEYIWGAFRITVEADRLLIRYETDGFQYEDETARLARDDARLVRFAGREISLD
ncbi:MAG: hypothetical protein AAFW46_01670 [Pseudomonadota bacterium]